MTLKLRSTPLLLFLPLAIYLLVSLVYLGLPGLHYDETLFGNAAFGNRDGSFVAWETTIAGCRFPVMLMPYIGALKAYLYYPIFKWWGTGVAAVRIPVILLGLATLFFTYTFVRRTIDPWTALVSVALLASDPTFIFMHKADWGPVALMSALKSASIYLIVRWFNESKTVWLSLACFLMGVGIFDKVIFLWFVVALIMAIPLCFWPLLRGRLTLKNLGIALFSFLAGCFPLVAFIVRTHGSSLSNPNVFALSRLQDLTLRWNVCIGTLNGTAVFNFFNNELLQNLAQLLRHENHENFQQTLFSVKEMASPQGTFHCVALILSFFVIGILLKRGRLSFRSTTLFYFFLLLFTAGLIFATPGATGIQHFAMLFPFSHIVIASALFQIKNLGVVRLQRWFPGTRQIAAALGLLLFLLQLHVDLRYLQSLRSSGGVGIWSDAIYRLAEFVKSHPNNYYALMDWGFSNQLLVLTRGEIRKEESFIFLKDAKNEIERFERMCRLLKRSDTIFVFHSKQYEIFPSLQIFNQALESSRLKARLRQTFYQRDGQPVYLLFEVFPD